MSNNSVTKRTDYFDYLRLIATFMVLTVHVTGQGWYKASVYSLEWNALNFYNSFGRCSVAIFVMISGALFLEGNHSIEKILKKYILRIMAAYVFWSIAYAFVNGLMKGFDFRVFVNEIIVGPYHMWYLLMISGVYLLIPFFKKITESELLMKYFMVLGAIFGILIPHMVRLFSVFIPVLGTVATKLLDDMDFNFTLGYVVFFIAGYYINKFEISKKTQILIYVLGIFGFIATVGCSAGISMMLGEPREEFYTCNSVNVSLTGVALFTFGKYYLNNIKISEKSKKVLRILSKYSFGAYLVHVMVIETLAATVGLEIVYTNPVWAVPVVSVIVAILAFALSAIINRIPVLNKYIV
ncbi:MAG: acyltransferase family protein [Agathobacter sp.]|nr:acyltransferase family protein [Agathobacter sp.]